MLLAPGQLLAGLTVNSRSASQFWIVRRDLMVNLQAPNDRALGRMVGGENSPYGPHAINNSIGAKIGAVFVVFPACGPDRQIKPQNRQVTPRVAANTIINVECN
jgi:hypothetical protein